MSRCRDCKLYDLDAVKNAAGNVDDSLGGPWMLGISSGTFRALLDELEALRAAAIGLRDDLLERAEWDDDAVKVVCAGNGAWRRFNDAIDGRQD